MAGLFQVKLHGTIFDGTNVILNVFGFKSFLAVSDEPAALAEAFENQYLPDIVAVLNDGYLAVLIEVFEMNGTGYANRIISEYGTRTGNTEPKFVAWGFRYQRAVQGQRSGAKRFGPVTDTDVDNGGATGGALTLLQALAVTLGTPIMEGIIETWFPIILVRPATEEDPWVSHDISGVTYIGVTTQNTRKR
jgi:hypothetical protein